jgi:hypothetical protein
MTPSVGLAVSRQGEGEWDLRQTYGTTAQFRARGGRWTSTLSLQSSVLRSTDAIRAAFSSQLRVTEVDVLTASIGTNQIEGFPGSGGRFSEYTASLRWSRRFR